MLLFAIFKGFSRTTSSSWQPSIISSSTFSSCPPPTESNTPVYQHHKCCNIVLAECLDKFQSAKFQECLDYMCGPLVLEGLHKIKEFAMNSNPVPNKTCGFQGSLANIPVQANTQISRAFNPANLNLGTPQSTFAHGNNQLIQNQQIKQESVVNPPPSPSLSQDNFNNLGNPTSIGSPAGRCAKHTLAGHSRGSTP